MRSILRGADHVVNFLALVLIAILALYSAYSVWYTNSLLNGSFLSDELAMYKPNGHEPTLAELMELNPDVCAWLTIDDTNIDYPVVQGETDSEYLNKNIEGEFSLAGAIFLSTTNSPDFTDPYNIVYGHHVEGGAMFADVLEFRDADYFKQHPTGILWLANSAYAIELFACMDVNAMDEVVYSDPSQVSAEQLPSMVDNICSRSRQTRTIDIVPSDSIIALSTCENASNFNRIVLFGKLVPMTAEQIAAAEAANAEAMEAEQSQGRSGLPSILSKHPWIAPSAGVLLFLILLLVFRRIQKSRSK